MEVVSGTAAVPLEAGPDCSKFPTHVVVGSSFGAAAICRVPAARELSRCYNAADCRSWRKVGPVAPIYNKYWSAAGRQTGNGMQVGMQVKCFDKTGQQQRFIFCGQIQDQ